MDNIGGFVAMFHFTDQSSVTREEKARRFLKSLANDKDYRYFHGDGYPRAADLHNDASAALEVFDEIAKKVNPEGRTHVGSSEHTAELDSAIGVIENTAGFADETTPVGEAWAVVLRHIRRQDAARKVWNRRHSNSQIGLKPKEEHERTND